ncbi:hypothetical protein K470DRAFT_256412 [Piedraia hortae CBS 480.64]|uniref:G-protein coupled receptors family 3 profile domain-containing protein n=1 Tax=Piedraia hortae CBS 480.64 TaxID=1314780 RepID=A0A6A7C320_9PEZI|nr:hypothetical protein K470DRAFT_256412 [Piedraia hortae CBS 480.64]
MSLAAPILPGSPRWVAVCIAAFCPLVSSRPLGFVGQKAAKGRNDNAVAVRMIFAATSLGCLMVLSMLFGFRVRSACSRKYWKTQGLMRLIPMVLYVLAISFTFATAITVSGMGMAPATNTYCRNIMYACLAFYLAIKFAMQFFLIERTHVVRNFKRRREDPVWIGFVTVVFCGLTIITVLSFLAPIGNVSHVDGQCRIGVTQKGAMVLLGFDLFIEITLTAVFVVLLKPLLFSGMPQFWTRRAKRISATPSITNGRNTKQLQVLVLKTITGAIVMMAGTAANLAVAFIFADGQHGWMCFICCLLDVTWSVLVIHILTETPTEVNGPMEARRAWCNDRLQATKLETST